MTIHYITFVNIGPGARFSFMASNHDLVVLSGAALGSTDASVINMNNHTNLDIAVLGDLVSRLPVFMPTQSSFTLGKGANFLSFESDSFSAGLALGGGRNFVQIDGTFNAFETTAILAGGSNNIITVTGSVSGASGVRLGAFGSFGDRLVNSGTIHANDHDDEIRDTRFNNAVYTDGSNTMITNLAGGTMIATAWQGNGVRIGANAADSEVVNHGTITSTLGDGIFVESVEANRDVTIRNAGVITGRDYSVRMQDGSAADLTLTNHGQLNGDIEAPTGRQLAISNLGGIINGSIVSGARYVGVANSNGRIDGNVLTNTSDQTFFFNDDGIVLGFIQSGASNDIVSNRNGQIVVGVVLGAGDDIYNGRGNSLVGPIPGAGDEGGVYGGDGNDRLIGGQNADWLSGDGGADTLTGGGGDDILLGGNAADILYGGAGDDALYGGTGSDTLTGGTGDDTIDAGTGNDVVAAGAGDDSILGGDGNDTLRGAGGDDTIMGGANRDLAYGGAGDDVIHGDTFDDTLYGGGGDDSLNGGTENDRLYGGAGEDTLQGGSGNDTLWGGRGSDRMSGGSGQDVFVFNTRIGEDVDIITDFAVAQDRIFLDKAIFTGLSTGALAASAFVANVGGSATTAAHRLLYDTTNGNLYHDVNGSGSGGRVLFATLEPGLALTHADFFVI